MTIRIAVGVLSVPVVLAVGVGLWLLRKAFAREKLLPEELALALAWVFVVGGLVWCGAYLSNSTLLGFREPWTWLAASHFGAAGFGALTVTAGACRTVTHPTALTSLRVLLVAHPAAYLTVAAGISGVPFCDELGATIYGGIFLTQLGALVFGKPRKMGGGPRALLLLSSVVPLGTIALAIAWAWDRPVFALDGMVRYHGIVNATGHVGLGLLALLWGRPESHSPLAR